MSCEPEHGWRKGERLWRRGRKLSFWERWGKEGSDVDVEAWLGEKGGVGGLSKVDSERRRESGRARFRAGGGAAGWIGGD